MKVIVQMTSEDFSGFNVCEDELRDWIEQAFRSYVDTWDGGLVFLDVFAKNLEIQRVPS